MKEILLICVRDVITIEIISRSIKTFQIKSLHSLSVCLILFCSGIIYQNRNNILISNIKSASVKYFWKFLKQSGAKWQINLSLENVNMLISNIQSLLYLDNYPWFIEPGKKSGLNLTSFLTWLISRLDLYRHLLFQIPRIIQIL